MTWVDLIILCTVLIGLTMGFWRGFVSQVFQVAGLVAAIIVTFLTFPVAGEWIETQFQLPSTVARPLSLLVIFFVVSWVFHFVAQLLHRIIAPMVQANPVNRALGAALGGARQLLFVSIILAVLVTMPTPGSLKAAIDNSRFGKPLIRFALQLEKGMSRWVDGDDLQSLGYQIVGTDQKTTTSLNFHVENPTVDETSEKKLYLMTNAVRLKEKVKPLKSNDQLREIARAHARDMLQKGYFSHVSPQGTDVAKRVQAAEITVVTVGENLAAAPSVDIAQVGLMASPGHKKNILSAEFTEIGIGVLDAGKYGKMVVQVFARSY